MLTVEFTEITDTGRVREHNEDSIGQVIPTSPAQVHAHGWLFALADGMGGHEHGEVASRIAIDTMLDGFRKIPKGVMHVSLLPRLVQDANAAVYEAGHAASGHGARMGTTVVACALRFDSAVVSHVGDSRCYLFRSGKLAPLTHDHTMVDEQDRLGLMTREEAAVAEGRHVLTRSLGSDLFVAADTITVSLLPGDVLLLCSDGLHGYISDDDIREVLLRNADLQKAAATLIAASLDAGGHDNVSVQLIRVLSVERMGLYRGRPYRLL